MHQLSSSLLTEAEGEHHCAKYHLIVSLEFFQHSSREGADEAEVTGYYQ